MDANRLQQVPVRSSPPKVTTAARTGRASRSTARAWGPALLGARREGRLCGSGQLHLALTFSFFPSHHFSQKPNFPSLCIIWFQHMKAQLSTWKVYVFKLWFSLGLVNLSDALTSSGPQSPFSRLFVASIWGVLHGSCLPPPQLPYAWPPLCLTVTRKEAADKKSKTKKTPFDFCQKKLTTELLSGHFTVWSPRSHPESGHFDRDVSLGCLPEVPASLFRGQLSK